MTNQKMLENVDLDGTLDREVYRDFLIGFLSSMVQGPTIPSIKSFVQQVSKVSPDILELAFNSWELGTDPLYLLDAQGTNVTYDLGKFNNGYVSKDESSVTMKASSDIRLEEGTLESYVIPEWDGIDNDATLTFQILKGGITYIKINY